MDIKLYNSLSRAKEEFKPIKDGEAGIYTCGPTVYDFAHIGNFRAYIFADTLIRSLKFNGFRTNWVMNITDVDDKTIVGSKEKFPDIDPKEALSQYTKLYEKLFWEDLKKLNITHPNNTPRATETISEMQDLIKSLLDKEFAYEKDGSIYFNIKKYSEKYTYGQLADLDLTQIKPGARVSADEYEKENISDFALWKAEKGGEPSWEFEINGKNFPGRPGWHIECSAMSKKYFEFPFDIHTGGIDLKFPHHEDEIAQNAAGCGCAKSVNYWTHNEYLLVDNKKMSKSLGNFYTLRDVENRGFSSLAFRFLSLQTHYRSKMNFTWESLEAAQNGLEHLHNQIRAFNPHLETGFPSVLGNPVSKWYKEKFLEKINDDLNMPQALAVTQELLKSNLSAEDRLATLLDFDRVLGLNLAEAGKQKDIPEEIKELGKKREQARKEKNWQKSDELRQKIRGMGYEIEDAETGYILKGK